LHARRPFADFRLTHTDAAGRVRHLSISGVPVFDMWGRFRGYRGVSREITAELEKEQRSLTLERRLFEAIENFPEAIILWDAEERLLHANSHYRKLVGPLADHIAPGARFEYLLRRAVEMDAFADPAGSRQEVIARRLAEHRAPTAPSEYPLRDGCWLLITERRTGDGGVLSIYTDITAQKQAQSAAQAAAATVQEKQHQLDTALDSIAQGITLYDADLRLVLFNHRYREIYRLPAELLRPGITLRKIMEYSVRLGNYRPEIGERVIEERLALARRRERTVAQQRLADGRVVELVYQPLPDGGSVATFTDATEREHASHALLAAKETAESANRAKSQFLAKMSHELRTPLNAVLGFSEIIRDLAFGRDAIDRYAAYAQDIHLSGEHLLWVINDILDMSKIEAGQTKIADDLVDVPEQVGQALAMLAGSARAAQVTLTAELAEPLPQLRADRRSILQVLLNLLSNAIKFSRPGGTVILSAVHTADGSLEMTVTDSGIGIAPADQARIFEPFFQAGGRARRQIEGTGLGLSICKSIMELHGGSIQIESNLDCGTRVTIRLPAERILQTT
jgi:two-component system cell cycle sensor histidine kinase PleC